MSTPLREWMVAGGVLVRDGRFLLVKNLRRNDSYDWSTPGGVIDEGESVTEGLSREVTEETGLSVLGWSAPLYYVEVTAPGYGFHLQVQAHRATGFEGEIHIDDPDGIVVDAAFVDLEGAVERLADASPWVAEPLLDHFTNGIEDGRRYEYVVEGSTAADRSVRRL